MRLEHAVEKDKAFDVVSAMIMSQLSKKKGDEDHNFTCFIR